MTVNTSVTASAAPSSKLACVSCCVHSTTRWKGPWVYSWKMEMKGGYNTTQGGVYGVTEGKAIDDYLFLHSVFCPLLRHAIYVFR